MNATKLCERSVEKPIRQLSEDDHGGHVARHVHRLAQGHQPAPRAHQVPLVDDGALVEGVVVLPAQLAGPGLVGTGQVAHQAAAEAFLAPPRLPGHRQGLPLVRRQVLVPRRPAAPVVNVGRHGRDDEVVVGPEHADGHRKEEHHPLEGPVVPEQVRQLQLLLLQHLLRSLVLSPGLGTALDGARRQEESPKRRAARCVRAGQAVEENSSRKTDRKRKG